MDIHTPTWVLVFESGHSVMTWLRCGTLLNQIINLDAGNVFIRKGQGVVDSV
jgi:hypothetical protein